MGGALEAGAVPIFVLAEKRYCVAAKMVETFLDPAHNSGAYWLATGANVERQAIANVFYGAPNSVIRDFAEAYKAPKLESFGRVLQSLVEYSNSIGRVDLSSSLLAQVTDLEHLVATESAEVGAIRRTKWIALNVTTFLSFMVLASALVRFEADAKVEVVHDQTLEFEPAFRLIFDAWRSREGLEVTPHRLQDGTVFPVLIDPLTQFRTGQSEREPEIQAADVLSSTLRWLAEGVTARTKDKFDKSLYELTLWPLLGGEFDLARLIASNDWTGTLLRPFREILGVTAE